MTEPIEIIVISLRESTQRRARAALQLDAAGLAWRFQDAVKGAALPSFPDGYDRGRRLRLTGVDMNFAEIGCFLSHQQAWQTCIQTQKLTLILEDDFQFEQEAAKVLDKVFASLPHFDVLRLQGIKRTHRYRTLKGYGKTKLVRHLCDPLGTTAYVVKPAAAKKLLEASGGFHEPVDNYLSCFWIHHLKILSLFPFPVKSDGSPSTVQMKAAASRLNPWRKYLIKLRRLPRSAAKRFYQVKIFTSHLFAQAEQG